MNEVPEVEHFTLEAFQYACQEQISSGLFKLADPQVLVRHVGEVITATLLAKVYAEEIAHEDFNFPWERTVSVILPRTWRQKLRKLPPAVVERTVSGTHTVRYRQLMKFPELPLRPQTWGEPIRFTQFQKRGYW